jgi:ATP-dependent RNA helicase RhlE
LLFKELDLIPPILDALEETGYKKPTPIQEKTIPIILKGKDLLGCAQTGTGKTAAFAIPIIQKIHTAVKQSKGIKALILTPTRELAIQIQENIETYSQFTEIKHLVIFGGVSQVPQVEKLKKGVDILVATPGRLLDLMNQNWVKLHELQILVLDEADRMLDMGFVNDVKKIIAKIPSQRQTLFFSATMPKEIMALANSILRNPEKVEVSPVSSTAEIIEQMVFCVETANKRALLAHLLKEKNIKSALVFTRTKHGADKVVKDLLRINVTAEAIHGNKSQNARQRALNNFKDGETRVLVATDIAARGIDIDNLSHVVNYELPNIPETYVHRIGRTGRAGASGIAYSFCDREEQAYLKDIEKLIRKPIARGNINPFTVIFSGPIPPPPPQGGKGGGRRSNSNHKKSTSNRNSTNGKKSSDAKSFRRDR